MQETQVLSLIGDDLLEKERATHSTILAWKIPWARGPWRAAVYGITESHDLATKQLNNHFVKISRVTIYSLDVLLSQFGTSPLFHVWF